MLIIYIIIYAIVLSVYMVCPLIGKLILLFLNCCISDPLPAIDEVIMVAGFIDNLIKLEKIMNYIPLIIIGIIVIIILF